MKKLWLFLAAMALMAVAGQVTAQELDEVDSVFLTGTVLNRHTQEPVPWCIMRFTQEGQTKATVVSDGEGYFELNGLPAGTYALHTVVHGRTLYQADLTLSGVAHLSIAIDTIAQVMLKTIEVVASKHLLGPHLIKSVNNRRLWGFNAGYRDANASVAMPPDAHGNSDAGEDGGATEDGPVGTPLFDPALPWQAVCAIVTGKLGTMLQTPPIWELVPDVYHPAPDSTEVKPNR